MNGLLIYDRFEAERNRWFAAHLIDEFARCGHLLQLALAEELHCGVVGGRPVLDWRGETVRPDFAVRRTPDNELARQLDDMGIVAFNNSRVCAVCNDKMASYRLAAACGLATPESWYLPGDGSEFKLPFPFVMKPVDGKGGRDVFLVKDESDYASAREVLKNRRHIVQRVSGRPGRDMRVWVIGGRAVAAIVRIAPDGVFLSNYCLGGRAEVCRLGDGERQLAERLAVELKADYIGVDFLFDRDGLIFNEMEDAVGARMLYDLTAIDPAARFADEVAGRLK
ncbi:MAG: hypothetical protein PHI35_06130 [Victivallaceae bacterium]|nr:hypothetical protein [Victivallaceae bacterium]